MNDKTGVLMMKKILSAVMSVAFVASLAVPVTVISSGEAEAASKRYCRGYARSYADRKATNRAVRDSLIAGTVGAIGGAILGGKRTTIAGAVGGGTVGAAIGSSKWQKYYDRAYYDCRRNF
jgi:hypothetical protein